MTARSGEVRWVNVDHEGHEDGVSEGLTRTGVKNVDDEQTTFNRVSSRTTVLRLEKLLNDAFSIVASRPSARPMQQERKSRILQRFGKLQPTLQTEEQIAEVTWYSERWTRVTGKKLFCKLTLLGYVRLWSLTAGNSKKRNSVIEELYIYLWMYTSWCVYSIYYHDWKLVRLCTF